MGIGGAQTGVYPLASPGGWQLLGRTPVSVFDRQRPEPILYRAGDLVHFVPFSPAEYEEIARAVAAGTYTVQVEEVPVCD